MSILIFKIKRSLYVCSFSGDLNSVFGEANIFGIEWLLWVNSFKICNISDTVFVFIPKGSSSSPGISVELLC